MQAQGVRHTEGPPRKMGQVFVSLKISNAIDAGMARRGALPAASVRFIEVDDVLVDTGATHLCLPSDIIRALGLEFDRQVTMVTASGRLETNVYSEARLTIEDRAIIAECLELPEGSKPLLGAYPMQALGVEPDLVNHVLRLLPEDVTGSWLRA